MNTNDFLVMVGKAACCHTPTIRHTYDSVVLVDNWDVRGDLIECGVYAGAQIAVMWRACKDLNIDRKIHAFDSFQGVPMPGTEDGPEWAGKVGKACSTRKNFDSFMTRWGVTGVFVHEGWFEDTVKKFRNPIALLRLDGDLYSSTLTCLVHLYPLVSKNGIVIVDDYALGGCRRAVHEYFVDDLPEIRSVKGGGGPVWWRKK